LWCLLRSLKCQYIHTVISLMKLQTGTANCGPLVHKSWNLCPGAGKSLCLWTCMGRHPALLEQPGLRCSPTGPEQGCPRTRCRFRWFCIDPCSCWVGGWCLLLRYLHFSLHDHGVFAWWRRYCKPGRHVL